MKHFGLFASLVLIALGASIITSAQTKKETKTMINKLTPILHVKSVEPAIKFWTGLGFKVTIQVPEGDHIGFVALDNGTVEVMYQTYQGMKADPSNPLANEVEKGPSIIFMEVANINAVIEAMKGAEIVKGPNETSYGAKEIVVKEPGGHFVIFSQLPAKK